MEHWNNIKKGQSPKSNSLFQKLRNRENIQININKTIIIIRTIKKKK